MVFLTMSAALLAPTAADAKRPTLNVAEKQRLPEYCWSRHGDPRYKGHPDYSIPKICGKAMNHICPGQIYLVAAQRATLSRRDREFFAERALAEFGYTKRYMTAECPLRQNLESSMALARMLKGRR
ncbi:MAG: hypothetical protein HYZ20_02985 [Burkholderiales bacterium]|nr:hypothetical protein [Burkholderiales bacterium]